MTTATARRRLQSPARRRGPSAARDAEKADCRSLSAQGAHGLIRISLQRVAGVLYVEREEIPKQGLRTMQSVVLPDADSLKQWFDEDPVRFEHPALHVQLLRDADQLWTIDGQPRQQ